MTIIKSIYKILLVLCLGIQASIAGPTDDELILICKDERLGYFGFVTISEDPFFYGSRFAKGRFTDNYFVGNAICVKHNRNATFHCKGYYLGIGEDSFESELHQIDRESYLLHLQRPKAYGGRKIESIECSVKN